MLFVYLIKINHRGSFGDISNKKQYFHIEPIERHPDSVTMITYNRPHTLYVLYSLSLLPPPFFLPPSPPSPPLFSLSLQLEVPHALYLATEYNTTRGSCGKC